MPRKLTKLKITEVASVDRGAGEGVKVVLSKRDFSAKERRRDAKSGAAMSDGSFPIHNRSDLRNAMRLAGHAKNPSKARAHIRSRARALGLTGMLSDAYKRDGWLNKARDAFMSSIESIFGVTQDPDKAGELIGKSADQFIEHVAGMTGGAEADDLGGEIGKGDTMSPEILKALGLADGTEAADVVKAIEALKARKPPPGRQGDDGGNGERESEREREGEKEKVLKALPEEILKALKEGEVLKGEVEALKKAAALEGFTKRAIDVGLPASEGETLMKAYAGGGNEAVDKLLGFLKAAHAQAVEAGIFKEFGASTDGSGTATALDELNTLAAQLRKADPKLSADAAFAKVYTDPANAKLAARERSENRPTIVASR